MHKLNAYFDLVKRTSKMADYHSVVRQLMEMTIVYVCRRIGPGGYLMAEMGKKQYDWHYKLGFYNGRQYVQRINQINNPHYYPATFNKLVEKAFLINNSIPTPRMLGHLNAVNGRCCDGENLRTADDLRALIERSGVSKFCLKLISGYGGDGFRAVEVIRKDTEIALLDLQEQHIYSVDKYYAALNKTARADFLIEQYVEQHPEVKKFNPSSINTLRIIIYQPSGQQPQCLGAYLRFGREGAVIDNRSAGGMGARIDLESGILHSAVFTLTVENSFSRHPDTGVLIEGERVTGLAEAIELARETVNIFPGIHFAGVDVAIGVDGPVIIELNAQADYVGFFTIKVPSRSALNG